MNDTSSILTTQIERLLGSAVDQRMLQTAELAMFPEHLWDPFTQLGLGFAVVDEAEGGAGLAWADVGDILKSIGYYLAPIPVVETMLASWTLGKARLEIPDGIVIPLEGILEADGNGRLRGEVNNVAWPGNADFFAGVAEAGGERIVCLMSAADSRIEATTSLGRDPRGIVRFMDCDPVAVANAPPVLREGLQPAMAAVRCAQIAGALSRTLEMSIEYANTRVQFGKPIGKFQALQHMLAEFACEAAAAGAAAGLALRALDADNPERQVAIAKIRCGMAATKGATAAHAIHGAIGVTEEHRLHYYTRRLWQWRDDAGTEHEWAERLGKAILSRPGSEVWSSIVDGTA